MSMSLSTSLAAGPLAPGRPRRLLVYALAWAAAAWLGTLSVTTPSVLLWLVAAVVMTVLAARPERIPLALLLAAMLVPFGLEATRSSRVPASLLLALAAVLVWVWALLVRQERLPPWRGTRAVLGFVLLCFTSILIGRVVLPGPAFERFGFERVQAGQLALLVISPLVLVLTASVLRTRAQVKLLAVALLAGVVLSLPNWLLGQRLPPSVNVGGMFSMWAGVLCWSFAWAGGRRPGWLRLVCLGLFLAVVERFFVQGFTWFSGWVPLGVAVIACTVVRSRRLAVPVTALGAAIMLLSWGRITAKYVDLDANRPAIWLKHLEYFSNSPLFGLGPAAPRLLYPANFGYSSHNNYLDVLTQTGLVGMLFFLWLLAELLLAFYRGQSETRDPFTRAYLQACLGALAGLGVAMMQGDWLIPFAYNQTIGGFSYTVYNWLLFGAGLALCLNVIPREAPAPAPAVPRRFGALPTSR